MKLVCIDLAEFGAVLISPDSQEYDALLAEIRQPPGDPQRIRPEDREISAIFVNRASQAVVAQTIIWDYKAGGKTVVSSAYSRNPILLPFVPPEFDRSRERYWSVILPGSKRYLHDSSMIGTNEDVRPPDSSETRTGGGFMFSKGRAGRSFPENVTVSIDGVFFEDGAFAGPDNHGLWHVIVEEAKVHLEASRMAREQSPQSAFRSLDRMVSALHPRRAPSADGFTSERGRERALERLSASVTHLRQRQGDEVAIKTIQSWLDLPLPNFRPLT